MMGTHDGVLQSNAGTYVLCNKESTVLTVVEFRQAERMDHGPHVSRLASLCPR